MGGEAGFISVAIPARNAESTLPLCLEALARQTVPSERLEVIVVDDASTDGTARVAEGAAGVRVFRQLQNRGPAAARNRGVREARGEVLVFTDADCAPLPDFVERLTAPLLADPAIAGAKGTYVSEQRELVARFVQLEYEDRYRRTARVQAARGRIDFVDTYAAAFRRDDFLAVGGFDESLRVNEDNDLSYRLAEKGKRIVFVPEARVRHFGHARSLAAYARKKYTIGWYKAPVLRRHPSKAVSDSHTPQVLKLEIALAWLVLALAAAAPLSLVPVAAAAGLFAATTVPFAARAASRDAAVALAAPLFLFVRSLALGAGLAVGALAQRRRRSGAEVVAGRPA